MFVTGFSIQQSSMLNIAGRKCAFPKAVIDDVDGVWLIDKIEWILLNK